MGFYCYPTEIRVQVHAAAAPGTLAFALSGAELAYTPPLTTDSARVAALQADAGTVTMALTSLPSYKEGGIDVPGRKIALPSDAFYFYDITSDFSVNLGLTTQGLADNLVGCLVTVQLLMEMTKRRY
jgi:hypothetical protein